MEPNSSTITTAGQVESKAAGFVIWGKIAKAPAGKKGDGDLSFLVEPFVFATIDEAIRAINGAHFEIGPITIRRVVDKTVTTTVREYEEIA